MVNRIPEGKQRVVSGTKIIKPQPGKPAYINDASGAVVGTVTTVIHRGRVQYHITPPAGGTVTCRRSA